MSQIPFHAAPGGQPDVIMDVEVAEPKMYQVLLHNDDYTTMEFVVNILMTVFHKTADQATNIMLAVHKRGKQYFHRHSRPEPDYTPEIQTRSFFS